MAEDGQVTTTVESGSTSPTQTTPDSVSQGDYISDAFSSYFGIPKSIEKKVETPKEKEAKKVETTSGDGAEKDKNPKEVSKDGEKEIDPFEKTFIGESGNFDLEKLMGVSLDGLEFKNDVQEEVVKTPENLIPQWKHEYEAEKKFQDNIRGARLGPLESVYNQVENSDIPPEYKEPILNVLRQEYSKVTGEINQYLQERDQENQYRKRQEEMDRIREETRSSGLPELARTNAMAVINTLPGKDANEKIGLYNYIMFGSTAGKELLSDMFDAKYPDFNKQPKDKQEGMKVRFLHELQSDGGRLRRHFDRAYSSLIADKKNLKRLIEHVSQTTDANVRSNSAAAQKSPQGSVQRQPQAGTSMWDAYFAPPERTRTRI